MNIATASLHFEPRPWTSPCVECGSAIPSTQSVTLTNPDRDAVCDDCGRQIDPHAAKALKVLRAIHDAWWRTAWREGQFTTGSCDDAAAYLRNVAAGVAMLTKYYGADPA